MSPRGPRRLALAVLSTLLVAGGLVSPAQAGTLAASRSASSTPGWQGQWLGDSAPLLRPINGLQNRSPLLRKSFTVPAPVRSARLRVAVAGYYQASINGRPVGDALLDPPPSQYDGTVFSRSIDVTSMLRTGKNAIGVQLGRAYAGSPISNRLGDQSDVLFNMPLAPWWTEPRLLGQLDITYANGKRQTIATDAGWKTKASGTRDALFFGESHDARAEPAGWTTATFDDSSWESATVQATPTRNVVPATVPPVRVVQTIEPVGRTQPKAGATVFRFARNVAGHARIRVEAPSGTTVTMRFGEQLNSDGTVTGATLGDHVDAYTVGASGKGVWEPRFTRHGFQYVQVESTKPLASFSLQARVTNTPLPAAGSFTSSNRLLDTVHRHQLSSLRANLWGFPTDTPWRDRQGWTADAWLYLDSAAYNYDVRSIYRDWLRSVRDSQRPDGTLPPIAPFSNIAATNIYDNDPSWGGSSILVVSRLHELYGDRSFVADNYETFSRWMALMARKTSDGARLYSGTSFGDWASPGSEANNAILLPPKEGPKLTANADLYREARAMAEMATLLGKPADAARWTSMADRLLTAFNAEFLDEDTGTYGTGAGGYRQTSNVMPLAYDMVPAKQVRAVVGNLVKDVVDRGYHLDTGAIGTKQLLPVLTRYGHGDVAYKVATQRTYPSWGYWIDQGATTSWEVWGVPGASQSRNHAFLGTVDDWFYTGLLGVDAASPGYQRATVRPTFPAGLDSASGQVRTATGRLGVTWKRSAGVVTLDVSVPRGVRTAVVVPKAGGGVKTSTVGSGKHRFRFKA